MENALLIGLSRQTALARQLEVIANNMANLRTPGFKGDVAIKDGKVIASGRDLPHKAKKEIDARGCWITNSRSFASSRTPVSARSYHPRSRPGTPATRTAQKSRKSPSGATIGG